MPNPYLQRVYRYGQNRPQCLGNGDPSAKATPNMRKFRDMISHRIDTPKARAASVLFTEFVDHGVLRHLWRNVAEIDDGVFRSNHPPAWRLRRFKQTGGATVLSLRGGEGLAQNVLERDICARLGLAYVCVPMASTHLPSRETVLRLVETLRDVERPVLMHCKSGADRTGIAAGIYLMAFKGASPDEAVKELTWRHVHLKLSKKGILHRFFEMYQPAFDAGQDFTEWVRTEYDPNGARVNNSSIGA